MYQKPVIHFIEKSAGFKRSDFMEEKRGVNPTLLLAKMQAVEHAGVKMEMIVVDRYMAVGV